ncbi:hypothetical protein B0H34DRAFT_793848 [Crassisporium funariophilum]|nr:hypothetical protein B0H34DRAFT_793848 [Crassisporium funariophilum]
MFACTRHKWRSALPRALAFSSSASSNNGMSPLQDMLEETSRTVSPIVPTNAPSRQNRERKWNAFQLNRVVKPWDLSYKARLFEQRRYKRPAVAPPAAKCRNSDPFHQLDLDPRDFTNNPVVLSEFLTEMGKIQGRPITQLTAKSQRLLGQTIRRAKMMGIIPNLSIQKSVADLLRSPRRR